MAGKVSGAARIELLFYRSAAGNEPVRDWLVDLPEPHRRAIGMDLQRVQYRWPVGMPLVRPMGKGLFEVRTPLAGAVLFPRGRVIRSARFYQKGAKDAGSRIEIGADAPERGR